MRFKGAIMATTALAAIGSAVPAAAADEGALQEIIARQDARIAEQQQQIAALAARLSALETGSAAAVREAAAPPVASPPAQAAALAAKPRFEDSLPNLPTSAAGQKRGPVKADWKTGGPTFASDDGFFTFHPRVRLMMDASTTQGSRYGKRNIAGTEARALFLGGEGTIGQMGYRLDVDLANDVVSLREAFLSYVWDKGKRQTQLYLGSKINDRGIDGSSADTLTPFLERNAVAVATAPQKGFFGFGAMVRTLGETWHASLAINGDNSSKAGDSDANFTVSGRAHWNPISGKNGFVHVGGWGYYEKISSGVLSFTRTNFVTSHFNDNLMVTSGPLLRPQTGYAYGGEFGGRFRSAYVLAEHGKRTIRFADRPDAGIAATSVYGGIFLTGETPGLSQRTAGWAPIRVKSAVTDGGMGAFEIGLRYDGYDFDNLTQGGEARAFTLGANWYLNNWSRLMINYSRWSTDNRTGAFTGKDSGDTISFRTQVAF